MTGGAFDFHKIVLKCIFDMLGCTFTCAQMSYTIEQMSIGTIYLPTVAPGQ